eukprot:3835584-Rhodomonas_salina.1
MDSLLAEHRRSSRVLCALCVIAEGLRLRARATLAGTARLAGHASCADCTDAQQRPLLGQLGSWQASD